MNELELIGELASRMGSTSCVGVLHAVMGLMWLDRAATDGDEEGFQFVVFFSFAGNQELYSVINCSYAISHQAGHDSRGSPGASPSSSSSPRACKQILHTSGPSC